MFITEEKEVVVHDVVGGVSNGRNEKKEKNNERNRETETNHIGQHLKTKAEAIDYLADLSHSPNLANWLAAEARENEARKLRRNWKSNGDCQVIGVGTSEVSAPENGANRIGMPEEHLQTDASLESEDAKLLKRQQIVDDLSKEGDEVENNPDSRRTISSETNQEDIIPDVFEKKADLEGTLSLEAQQTDRNDNTAGEDDDDDDDNIHYRKRKKKKKKVCGICGHLGHKWDKCKKVNSCLYCKKKGHLPQHCPRKDIVRGSTKFCLKCVNLGHDMFSCTNDYPAEDLEKIQCCACKEFGHLCCSETRYEGPMLLSCYNCGETGHQGPECNKEQPRESMSNGRSNRKKRKKLQKDNESPSATVHPNSSDEVHPGQQRHKKAKLGT